MGGGMLRFGLAVVVWLSAGAHWAAADDRPPPLVTDVGIRIVSPASTAEREAGLDAARRLIRIRAGDRLTAGAVEAVVDSLKAAHWFEAIHVDSEPSGSGVALVFALTPFRRVKEIRTHGQFPLFKKDLLQVMTLAPGSVFTEKSLKIQAQRIAALYRREGFPDPAVSVTAEPDPKDGQMIVHVRIREGDFVRVGGVRFSGNRSVAGFRLKWMMRTWLRSRLPGSAGRFVEKERDDDVKRLLEFYRKRGFADAAVSCRVDRDASGKRVLLTMEIQEGPRYQVHFAGNHRFSNRELRRDLVLFVQGNAGDAGLRKSVGNIRRRYRQHGYGAAAITVDTDIRDGDGVPVRHVTIRIAEGIRTVVGEVTVAGNRSLPDAAVLEQVLARPPDLMSDGAYVPDMLDADMDAVEAFYLGKGFPAVRVERQVTFNTDRSRAAVRIQVAEGDRERVGAVDFPGLQALTVHQALAAVRLTPGADFREYMVESDANSLAAAIAEKGYPHVSVSGSVARGPLPGRVRVTYRVEPGEPVRMGRVYVSGNFRTRTEVIAGKIPMKRGEPFSLKKLTDGQQAVRALSVLDAVKFRTVGLREKADTVHLFVEVTEKAPYTVEAAVGYDSEAGVFASGRLGDDNFMGLQRKAWIAGDSGETGYRFGVGFSDPAFTGLPIEAGVDLFTERRNEFNQDFGLKRTGAGISFSSRITAHLNTNLGLRVERRQQFEQAMDATVLPGEDEPRTVGVVTPSVQFDTRDSAVRPRKGGLAALAVDVSAGLDDDLDDFIRPTWDVRYYVTPLSRLTLAFAGRAGAITPFGTEDGVPKDQLFFLGGTASVRGFAENMLRRDSQGNPLGGRYAVSGSVETRIDLGRQVELTCFYDAGRVGRPLEPGQGDDGLRHSVGIGIRYLTPIGPVGLLYGHKLDRGDGEDAGRFHFSIGYTF